MPPIYPRPYLPVGRQAGHFAGGTRDVFLGRSAPPRALIVVAIHPRAYTRDILAHTSKIIGSTTGLAETVIIAIMI
ncbi:MAG: hypothetical protein A3C13_00455 [Candidatus Lloydbacteria bacterium RIFCSPHIGHO2_02_FULL_50_11]|nr:MAG: hypothetical protein A3C13_00455 [Candidatus Lloydbacteria bacterium RIFCSPHIGHO2_02_FULL_50_11]